MRTVRNDIGRCAYDRRVVDTVETRASGDPAVAARLLQITLDFSSYETVRLTMLHACKEPTPSGMKIRTTYGGIHHMSERAGGVSAEAVWYFQSWMVSLVNFPSARNLPEENIPRVKDVEMRLRVTSERNLDSSTH